ncbi:hypothetical protein OG894_37985 [Streptomyces sp. NBC_01724]|uniref:hypothetical protein n=1 Tax=unclassified Streptomyces TaxID=2593676 RepID=UPI002E36E813|nr:hypothetical protein [Streptomyces sp. NBC_01724]WTE49879.1 hypothetical protein OG987_03765 [Streptomyces sp. NBC_01620]WTE57965.1 hypothetical protein OG784_03885 [Streptomyces sp. NBC_01617]
MRHRPFFRWVLTLGVLLFGWSAYLYASYPETRQIDLTVISEKPDGRCTVRWKDPYTDGGRWRATAYRCDPDRDALLKAPNYDEDTGYGWDSGFMFTEGRHKGDLEPSLEEKEPYGLSDALVLIGLALTAVGLIGGNAHASIRLTGVRLKTVARARKLYEIADQVARDHAQARDAVRVTWNALRREQIDAKVSAVPVARLFKEAPVSQAVRDVQAAGARTARDVLDSGVPGLEHMGMDRNSAEHAHSAARLLADDIEATLSVRVDPVAPGPHTVALLVALQVLLEAGAEAHQTARAGEELAGELERVLTEAEPASGYLSMLRAGREQREIARSAVTELRSLMAIAEQEGLPARFTQTSVDLLRVPDDRNLGLSARADFESRTSQYYGLLAQVVDSLPGWVGDLQGRPPTTPSQH